MVRYLVWVANTALFVVCCFLVASTANAIIASWLRPPPEQAHVAQASAAPAPRTWDDWQVIVSRNLFHSRQLSAPPPPVEVAEEDLEETTLPLKLWGTLAAEDPTLAWASVEDLDARETQAVSVGDQIKTAEVVAIERRRVVLLENGKRRSLSLGEEEVVASAPVRSTRSTTRARNARSARAARARARARQQAAVSADEARESMADRVRKLAEDRFEVDREDVHAAMSNPASLYTQARILPSIDEETGEVAGLQISAIKPGSVFEQVGIQEGEVIIEVGGVPINDVGQSASVLSGLVEQAEVSITVLDEAGNTRPLTLTMPAE